MLVAAARAACHSWSCMHAPISRNERGATMTEYGALLFIVTIAVFGALLLFGSEVVDLFQRTEEEFDAVRNTKAPRPD